MSENFHENSGKFPEKSNSILHESGISYAQIPRKLFKLSRIEGITASDVLMALSIFDYCHDKRKYPKFELSHSQIAEVASVSRRQSMYGMQRLIEIRLFSVSLNGNKAATYQWNEFFLRTGELYGAKFSPVDVQNFHQRGEKLSPEEVKELHHVYIEFLLDFIYKLYKAYFDSNASLIKRVPGTRRPKGVPQGSGTLLYISRKEAWREAIQATSQKSQWVRIYCALAGGFNIEEVNHPTAYLKKIVFDEARQHESKRKSNLYNEGHLDSDLAFLNFIQERNRRGHVDNDEGTTEVH